MLFDLNQFDLSIVPKIQENKRLKKRTYFNRLENSFFLKSVNEMILSGKIT